MAVDAGFVALFHLGVEALGHAGLGIKIHPVQLVAVATFLGIIGAHAVNFTLAHGGLVGRIFFWGVDQTCDMAPDLAACFYLAQYLGNKLARNMTVGAAGTHPVGVTEMGGLL